MDNGGKPADFPSKVTMSAENGVFSFTFFCELCGHGYAARPISAAALPEAYAAARWEARSRFNRCCRCHRWVCDGHYNEDLMLCTHCAPRQAAPDLCPACGAPILAASNFCPNCGAKLDSP